MVMKGSFFSGYRLKVFLHLVAWIIMLVLPLYVTSRWNVGKDFIWLFYINAGISGFIFYLNYLILVPILFFGRRNYRYYISVVLLVACFYFVSDTSNKLVFKYISNDRNIEYVRKPQETEQPANERKPPLPPRVGFLGRSPFRQVHLFNYTFTSLFMIFFSFGLRMLEHHSQVEKRQKELEKEKLNSELTMLKNQISPHFFFNTLNNIYSLIGINKEDSQEAVLKLSKLMRYLLYESEHGQTLLSNEIDFMNNYIDLMKLRISDSIDLSVDFPEHYENISLPPLLFLPFIENAFKHGISYREPSFIRIGLSVDSGKIHFTCSNRKVQKVENGEEKHSGIGMENVTKRLLLLFPGKHRFDIDNIGSEYNVRLTIDNKA